MTQPELLKKDEPLLWSTGQGTDVWALFCACIADDLEAVRQLIAKDPSLVSTHFHYRTPIYFAVRENSLAVARFLLDHGADPLSLAVNDSLLEITRDRSYTEMEKLLVAYTRSQNTSPQGEAVGAAARGQDIPGVLKLIDEHPALLHAGDSRGNQPIHWATMTRNLGLIDALLARGADINAKRFDGARPVQLINGDYHFRGWREVPKDHPVSPGEVLAHLKSKGAYVDICTASHMGDLQRVRELLDEDPALANRPSDYVTYYLGSGTPLRNAAACGHNDVVKLLLARGADPNQPEEGIAPKGHALYSAVYNGHHETARILLEAGAYPSPPVESSADALSIALGRKDDKMVELLCSYGSIQSVDLLAHEGDFKTAAAVFAANPTLADDPDAFSSAVGNGHESFVRLMLRYQTDLATRVSLAAKTPALTEFLFERGMNPGKPDWLGITPLHEFARRGDTANATLFLDRGASIHARDEDICSTPLAWAAKFNQLEMLKLLLARGAQPNLPDDPAWATPLAWATRRNHRDAANILLAAGAR